MHLTPFEVLIAVNHAQLQLNRTFSDEEIKSGVLADLMIDEDFNFEETVSLLLLRTRVCYVLETTKQQTRVCTKFVPFFYLDTPFIF